jgi:uncharacterized protein (DUF885 family)
MTTVLSLILAAAVLGAGAFETAGQSNPSAPPSKVAAPDTGQQLARLYDEFWEESLRLNPIQATFVGDPRYNAELPNFLSADYRARQQEFHRRWLDRVQKIDGSRLTGQARLSYDIFVRDRQNALEASAFPQWMIPINQFQSFATFAPQLGSGTGAQPFKTVKDYDDWLARAGKMPALFDQAIANMREGMKAGVVQPKVLMQKVLPQLDALVKEKPEDTLFWQPVAKMPAEFAEADRTRLTGAFRELVSKDLIPAYKRLRAFIADEYLEACRDTVGLDALPSGKAWYAFNARTQTTTDLAPERIHQIGLDEVARIHGEMRKVMAEVGFKGELPAFFKHVTSDPRFTFSSEDALLEAYNAVKARVDAGTPRLFSLTPKAAFEIRPVEAFRAASAAGGQYFPPNEDGSRPGIFYVNTHDLPARKTWEMESLFLHEAIPGHHFQIALQQELQGLPRFRRFGGETAFIEGWGLYAESLGKELGVYTDPYQYFGRLQAELWRAIRLVVDTGLHSKGWTREAVIRYMLENSATSETHAVAEAERYIAIPGQALAYKIGELKIKELRARAERALGAKFDVRAFHREVLQDGSVPLGVLESKLDRWIAAERQAASRSR